MRQCNKCSHYGDRSEAMSLCMIAHAWVPYCGICENYAKAENKQEETWIET